MSSAALGDKQPKTTEYIAFSGIGGRIMSGKKARKYEEETELRKGPWTLEEDTLLIHYIACHGEGRWNLLARCSGLKRTGKSCRLRWLNYLKPDVKRGNLTPEEQFLILELHSKWGNRWSRIAQHLPGRTDNEIKNYWRTRVQKQAKQLKIDANSELFRDAVRRFWMPRLMEKIGPSPPQASVVQSMDNPTFVHPLPRQPPNHPMIPPAEPTLPPTTRCSTATALNDVPGRYQLLQFEDDCSPSISVDAMAAGSSRLLAPAPPDRHHQIINATGNDKYTTTYDPFLFAGGDFTNLAYGFDGLDFHQERMAPPLGAVGSSSASDCSMMMEVEDGMDGRGRGGNHNNNTMMADSLFSILMNCDMQSEKLHEWD